MDTYGPYIDKVGPYGHIWDAYVPYDPLWHNRGPRLSFSARTHEHCSQEMLGVTGNLDGNPQKISFFIEALTFSNGLCLIPLNKVTI